MNVLTYLMESRGITNTMRRLPTIAWRFGVSTAKMEKALETFVRINHAYNSRPTLAVTSVLLERYPKVFQKLNEEVELAVHGYVHTDYSQLDEKAQAEHLERSLQAFERLGIRPTGFRCPYLRWNEHSLTVANDYGLTYGSNRSVAWDVIQPETVDEQAWAAYEKGRRLYGTEEAADALSLPSWINGSFLDIPASLPDDEAMIDRLGLTPEGRAETWLACLKEAYTRGEMLTIILHHERVPYCAEAIEATLQASRQQRLPVYVASLGEIAEWWRRRSKLSLVVERVTDDCYRVVVPEDDDVTVLVRGAETDPLSQPWDTSYRVAPPGNFIVKTRQAPVISLDKASPASLKTFLKEEGFVVWDGVDSGGFPLKGIKTFGEKDKRRLLETIEASGTPRVRLWRWPKLARCAMSVTGDIDAMTLVDFLRRPFEV